jgi:hypothetical protein
MLLQTQSSQQYFTASRIIKKNGFMVNDTHSAYGNRFHVYIKYSNSIIGEYKMPYENTIKIKD